MRTETVSIYKFDELTDSAKEKARDWWRTCTDENDYDHVLEDAKTIAALFGLEIENIYFSGFCCQGDGACFTGDYQYKAGALASVKDHAPKDEKIHEIVEILQGIQRPYFYELSAQCAHSGRYSHSGCMSVETEYSGDDAREIPNDTEGELRQALRWFADWIYNQLDEHNTWLMSAEQIDETITVNEYEFTIDGAIH